MITITPDALTQLKACLEPGQAIRAAVTGGGCSGFQYQLITESDPPSASDLVLDVGGVAVYVDPISKSYLEGAEIRYTNSLMGGGFSISNPNAESTCGCGQSFAPKLACR
jgi:iron-sulfur cluster assembly accessory protein